jgi:hypothetical protein
MGAELIFYQFSRSKAVFGYFELPFDAEPPP